jgi:signal transduction histidine kinase
MDEDLGTPTGQLSGVSSVEQDPHASAASDSVLSRATEAFGEFERVAVVWLAVRESRARSAVIRAPVELTESVDPGLRIEPGLGAGGTVLLNGWPWRGAVPFALYPLAPYERELVISHKLTDLLIVPLLDSALGSGQPRVEGLAYLGTRDPRGLPDTTVAEATRLGEQVGRAIRDAQRFHEGLQRWKRLETTLPTRTQDDHLDTVAHQIAADARVLLRSGIGIVFRLDPTSGALHSLGVDGADLPELRLGQVLPPGFGSAGRAVATRAPFVANDYAGGTVQVPPIMSAAVPGWIPFTTLSVPFIAGNHVIGALTVARASTMPYAADEIRLAEQAASEAAPIIARAQEDSEIVRRQQGASELSRLAASLTQDLSLGAVCERLVRSVLSLVRGVAAVVRDARGILITPPPEGASVFQDPADRRLQRLLQLVAVGQRPFWTPDLGNDPRLAGPDTETRSAPDVHGAVLAVPVRVHDKILATVAVSSQTGHSFSLTDVELVQGLADQAALAMATVQVYHDLQFSRAALLRHEKLVAIGRLAAGLAHELRNPLQNAVGFIAELRDRVGKDAFPAHPQVADLAPYLKQAHAELRRAASIVDRLLDYVRERKPTLETVDVRQLVGDAAALMASAAARESKRIAVAPPAAPFRVRADPVMLRQVMVNVLTNALDALDPGGSVHVEMRLKSGHSGPGRVEVVVRDTGRGIAPDDLPRVFDPFFTTKEVGKGVGLGLAVCQAIIEQHKGTITIASPGPGRGAMVIVELPVEP